MNIVAVLCLLPITYLQVKILTIKKNIVHIRTCATEILIDLKLGVLFFNKIKVK